MKQLALLYAVLLLVTGILSSCDATRTLSGNEQLYTGAKVVIEAEGMAKSEKNEVSSFAEELIRPLPNTTIAGVPVKLLIHGLGKVGARYGESPVLFSRVDPAFTSRLLQNELDNRGYFRAKVQYDTLQQGRKVKVVYKVQPGEVYRIGSVYFPDDTSSLAGVIREIRGATLLKSGIPYSLDLMKAERLRIDEQLKERGYYYFSAGQLLIQADSTAGNRQVDLKVIVKPGTPEPALEKYYVRNVIFDPPQDFRPGVLESMLRFQRNTVYNRTNHNLALHRLVSMGNFQFVRNRFVAADTAGNYLDAVYILTPFPERSLQAEISARTNSADYSGTSLRANWSHRNAFRGGELFTVSVIGSMDLQAGKGTTHHLYRTGMEAGLVWPRLVAPFGAAPTGKNIPKTRAAIAYELQHRSELYTRHQFSGSFGYQWKRGSRSEHRLMLADITYANPAYVSAYYQALMLAEPGLAKSVEREFITGPSYSFEYTTTLEQERVHRRYVRSTIQTSAVLLGLLRGTPSAQSTPPGVPFSQFVRLEQEYRHFFRLHPSVELAGRILAGAGIPYGNSEVMPYARQFFSGGSTSLRAFPARSVGPGTYRSPLSGSDFLPDASGDLKLELNAELRAKLYRFVNGALFIDAGNVWLLNASAVQPGGNISSGFLNELAIGTGAGIRLDFSMIVLRVDLAIPLHKPWLPLGSRWVGAESDFGSSAWWKNNRIWNIAIGYPF